MAQEANNHSCGIDNCKWVGQRAKWGRHALKKHVDFIIKEYKWQTTGGATNEDEIICNESLNSSICFECGTNYKYNADLENIVIKNHYKKCSFNKQKAALCYYMDKHNKPISTDDNTEKYNISNLEKTYKKTLDELTDAKDDIDYWRKRTCCYIEKCKEYSKVLKEHNIRDDIGID
jgi:hypothetical protein